MSPAAEKVLRRLDAARQQWWLFTLLTTAVLAICVSLFVLMLFMLADALFHFSRGPLVAMGATWLAVTVALAVFWFRRLARSHRSLEATARRVEAEFPELESDLINVVQLANGAGGGDRQFVEAAVVWSASRVGHVRFEEAACKETWWGRFRYGMHTMRDFGVSCAALGLLIALAIVAQMVLPNWGSAASRLMKPWRFVPSVGSAGPIEVAPGDTEVLVGEGVTVTARVRDREGRLRIGPAGRPPFRATLFVQQEGEEQETATAMIADEENQCFVVNLPAVLKPLVYRVEVHDSQSPVYRIRVQRKPAVERVEVTYRFPRYLGRPDGRQVGKEVDLEAPQFTEAVLRIRPTVPVAKGYVDVEGKQYLGRIHEGGRLVEVKVPLLKNATFTIHLFTTAGHTDPNPRVNRIRVLPDKPPSVELVRPSRPETMAPGDVVAVTIRAKDDYGLGRVELEMKVTASSSGQGAPEGGAQEAAATVARTVRRWTDVAGEKTGLLRHRLSLEPDSFRPGQTVWIRAVAWDRRDIAAWGMDLRPQQAATEWRAIQIIDRQQKTASTLDRLDSLRGALWKILEKQIRTRVATSMILRYDDLATRRDQAAGVRAGQIAVQKDSISLVKSLAGTQRDEERRIRRSLNELAFGDMILAVEQCDALVKIAAAEGFERPVAELNETQGRIVEALRALLDVTRRTQAEELAELADRPGADLPPEVQDKLREVRDKLEEFAEQQKKVIEATENLAKTPVEDFTEEEEQLLKQLAASQDEWSKLMQELHSDLSKLPEQDFSNPSLLKELNEIQTELKMAADALLKKSADIAVPLEQLGAEMAEEITTNIEKWLPDTPDRERWSQEESLTDAGKEAPMAELPGELEDLIGELMEEEEDLFDEMEDVSSSAADSLDKGAGWDVADGPISNMSAKGATGNRLPNTSEIGGRAGEGRSGKSSGEFVGDEAVGKGGRKTPSRLTPDPFVKGQIKDHSRDAQGGATGGGKESGQGGEGLEGPTPGSRGQRDLARLAGKQAELRNRAEAIDLRHFQVMGYHHTDLEKMIELMRQIERDLKAGRYRNALRQRKVLLDGLGRVKQYVEGEFEVRQDRTLNLPADIQKEILGSMLDPSPVGWEEINRQYFERLTTGEEAHR
ncbi:MAG TPA: hypothetical protein EYH34_13625 [Planctomycetes bacterium]|nr:hypothetical protein [Planctomycetota bacterium]